MNQESYNLLETMSKRFKVRSLDDNVVNTNKTAQTQRVASVVTTDNIQYTDKDSLCANMISEVVKVAAERVKSKQSRTASISSVKVDELGQLKRLLSTPTI